MLGYQFCVCPGEHKLFLNGEEDVRLAVQAAADRRLGRGEDVCAVSLL